MRSPAPLKMVLNLFKFEVLGALLGLIIMAILNVNLLLSFFLGEFAMVLGNSFLAWCVYRQNKRIQPMPLLMSFLSGEMGKYFVLIVITLIMAKLVVINWLFYIIGIAVPQLAGVILYLIYSQCSRFFKPKL